MNTYKVKLYFDFFNDPCSIETLSVEAETPEQAGLSALQSQLGDELDEVEKAQGFVEVEGVKYELEWIPRIKPVSDKEKIIILNEYCKKITVGRKARPWGPIVLRANPSLNSFSQQYWENSGWEIVGIIDEERSLYQEDNPLFWERVTQKIRWVKIRNHMGDEGWIESTKLEVL